MKQLLQIQSELKAPKNQFNSFGKYKYRNAEDILEALKPLLLKYECILTLSDEIKETSTGMIYVESSVNFYSPSPDPKHIKVTAQAGIDLNAKGMSQAQCVGASSSYARKYALGALFLLDDSQDADATNTHGKETKQNNLPPTYAESMLNYKSEILAMTKRLPEDKRQAAIDKINSTYSEQGLDQIKQALSKY